MFATGVNFLMVTALVKIVGSSLPAAQAAFLRYLLGLVFLLPFLVPLMRLGMRERPWKLYILRGLFHGLGVLTWFYAMTRIPIAEVTAMNYLNPVYVTLGAALFMGEKLAWRRVTAIAVAFLGVLVILRPGFREISDGHVVMLFTAVFFAGSYLAAKRLSAGEDAGVIVAMLSITVTILLAPVAVAVWVPPAPVDLVWLFLVALFATAGHYTMTRAFRAAPLTVTQPVTFLQLVWATLLGWLAFDEVVDGWVLLGGGVILAAVVFLTWREAVLNRRVTPAADVPKL
ncbi:threonine/homoserine efflux transporter RhtA [Rhodovulum imhoffii]|uniref:Threonine/homoserine efflux transporter RhtA n=2 Tax=Rhodovulum imhoffii TaxID=365340 RepID=A0A2T5BW50_9RHOB|nr:threonine/homoserine efflux transporter RhtA [Rhodovulum imhoffii]